MKILAYFLILAGLLTMIATDIVIENMAGGYRCVQDSVQQEMFASPEGRKAILSYIKAKDAQVMVDLQKNQVRSRVSDVFIFLFGIGVALLFSGRLKKLEKIVKNGCSTGK